MMQSDVERGHNVWYFRLYIPCPNFKKNERGSFCVGSHSLVFGILNERGSRFVVVLSSSLSRFWDTECHLEPLHVSPTGRKRRGKTHARGCLHLPSGNELGVLALPEPVGVSDLEHGADGAAVLADDAVDADEVLAAIVGVRVAAEGPGGHELSWGGAHEVLLHGVCGGKKEGGRGWLIPRRNLEVKRRGKKKKEGREERSERFLIISLSLALSFLRFLLLFLSPSVRLSIYPHAQISTCMIICTCIYKSNNLVLLSRHTKRLYLSAACTRECCPSSCRRGTSCRRPGRGRKRSGRPHRPSRTRRRSSRQGQRRFRTGWGSGGWRWGVLQGEAVGVKTRP